MHPYATAIALALLSTLTHAATLPATSRLPTTLFSYDPNSPHGPSNWHKISRPHNAACGKGTSQSPINIDTSATTRAPNSRADRPRPALKAAAMTLDKSRYNWQLSCNTAGACGTTTFKGKTYTLVSITFHALSEHTVNGVRGPLEMHMQHEAADGSKAVLSTLFRLTTGRGNRVFDKIVDAVEQGQTMFDVNLPRLSKNRKGYYVYSGSLTTPPCTEGVTWMVARKRMDITQQQLDQYVETAGNEQFGNHRPLQQLNGRVVSKY